MTIDLFIVGFTVLINFLLGLVILVKNRKPLANKIFLITILFILAWAISNYNIDTASSSTMALVWLKLFTLFTFLFIYAFFVFIQVFSSGKFRVSDPLNVIMTAFVLFMIPFLVSNKIFLQAHLGINGLEGLDNGPLFILLPVSFITMILLNIFFLVKKYRQAKNQLVKSQILYFATGWGLFFSSIVIVAAVLPSFFPSFVNISKIVPTFSIFMVSLTTYAILKHQFLDIRIIIQRGLIYLVLLGILAGVYISGLQFLGYLLHKATAVTAIVSAGITMVLGILFIRPLENYFRKVTDPIFFKDKYNYPEALHQLSKVPLTNIAQADIIKASSDLLKAIFKTRRAVFRLGEGESEPESGAEVGISMPIVLEEKNVGVLELGPKLSGDSYTSEDKKLLETFAYQAAVALEKGRLYEQVQEYSTHLEQLVEKRTEEIKEMQESQKQVMIDISHNLQTPLAVIKGELELLKNTSIDKENIHSVEKSLGRVSQFIRQLLHLAKLNQSSYSTDLSPVNLSELIGEQAEYFETMATEKDVRIISSIAKNIMILGNKQLLKEMLTNLVVNAITYRRANMESIINISLKKTDGTASIIIEDNGVGIPPKDIPGIFDRFYVGSRKSGTSGTGLGLAICKKIVGKHNGTISAASVLGEKTTFVITLPLSA